MKYQFVFLLMCFVFTNCKEPQLNSEVQIQDENIVEIASLNLIEAERLAKLPLDCVTQEYPNKLNQVIGSAKDLSGPKELHPSFYGCFDWHSAVHGHWSLVSLLKQFPELVTANDVKAVLISHISQQNILNELMYFDDPNNKNFERTYGWAWLLKLAEELYTWDDPLGKQLYVNLEPMTKMIVKKYKEFLPKLVYPIRVGEHPNTAFGLSFALDFARITNEKELEQVIVECSKTFFLNDKDCPITWEPSGYDFLSPCLEEANLMSKVLNAKEYENWLSAFLPELLIKDFTLDVGLVGDRSDGKLVHLDGVNFSRAWCLNGIANKISNSNHLRVIAQNHIQYSLPNLIGDDYEGGHWLGSFAIYALNSSLPQ